MSVNFNISDMGLTNVEVQSSRAAMEADAKKTESFQQAFERASANNNDEELMTACKDFETYFIQMMYKEMRKTVHRDANSLIPKSQAEEYFQDMLDEQYSIAATNSGGIGLTKFLYQQLSGQYQLPAKSPFRDQS